MGTESARVLRGSPSLWLVAIALFGLACSVSLAQSQDQTPQPAATQMNSTEAADEALLKAVQNPVADLISVPIQNNINPGIAPYGRVQNVISLQPVIPLNLGENWMLITRIIQPIVWQPYPDQKSGGVFGLGDMNPSFFLAPKNPGAVIWGAGPAVVIPTATSQILGQGKLESRPFGGGARATRPMDGRRVGQQRLVSGGVGWTPSGQSHGFAVFYGLQPAARLVPELVAHDNRRLARHCRQCVDCAIWVGSRKARKYRPGADGFLGDLLWQCDDAGRHAHLVDEFPSHIAVS